MAKNDFYDSLKIDARHWNSTNCPQNPSQLSAQPSTEDISGSIGPLVPIEEPSHPNPKSTDPDGTMGLENAPSAHTKEEEEEELDYGMGL